MKPGYLTAPMAVPMAVPAFENGSAHHGIQKAIQKAIRKQPKKISKNPIQRSNMVQHGPTFIQNPSQESKGIQGT
jgi:hypothetical protein